MTAWPATLPQSPLTTGYSQSQVDNAVRSAMSYGPDKVRRRTTVAIKQVNMQLMMTQAQTDDLETFYNTTIQVVGVVDWIDHRSGATARYRFLAPPAYTPVDDDWWSVTLQMEILP